MESCDCSVVRDLGSGPWAPPRSFRPKGVREPSARRGADASAPPLQQFQPLKLLLIYRYKGGVLVARRLHRLRKKGLLGGKTPENIPPRLNRLRKKALFSGKAAEKVPQGLKPLLYFVAFVARLKPCPCYKT